MTTADAAQPSKRTEKERERNLTRVQARAASERARADFAETLNALEDKLNLPKQARRKGRQVKARLRRMADEQPGVLLGAAIGAVAVVGVTVWLVVRAASSDD
ncbi:4-aminobutyrate aminotransferase-like enzyme [Agromyces terreus]|uniref:4-aminobutyrate aminotransferase-like enzyme n=1 Tax=Agromyces terreus TaxID=424795 RepID=A0A9X2KBI9_9MICO|nr:DUF3618 domain-containing protein [Agromyces terreus]MCP2370210.1 4-aminobutyrate aminotransferase-like enzyme [Agromyces terreus]